MWHLQAEAMQAQHQHGRRRRCGESDRARSCPWHGEGMRPTDTAALAALSMRLLRGECVMSLGREGVMPL